MRWFGMVEDLAGYDKQIHRRILTLDWSFD